MRFAIKLPCHNRNTLPICGDYYFGLGFSNALHRLGFETRLDPHDEWDSARNENEIDIVLRGQHEFKRNSDNPTLIWVISNPASISVEELAGADHVFVASQPFTAKLEQQLGKDKVSLLPQAFDRDKIPNTADPENKSGITFVGMNRPFPRPVVQYSLEKGIDLSLYGNGWDQSEARRFLKASRVTNTELFKIYAGSRVILNDHTPEMRDNGFCSNRIFDSLGCGVPVVTDNVSWVPEDIHDWIYFFHDADSFETAVQAAANESDERASQRAIFTKAFRENHSFDARARDFIRTLVSKGLLGLREESDVRRESPPSTETPKVMTRQQDGTKVRGLYINLDQSEKRRQQCEEFLSSAGLTGFYDRFPGIPGVKFYEKYKQSGLSAGKIGCWLSHLEAIRASLDHNYHFHLLEDDFQLTSKFPEFVRDFDRHTASLGEWDILFTDFTLTNLRNVNDMRATINKVNRLQNENRFVIENARPLYAAGNSSYIVNRKSKQKVADVLEKGLGNVKMPKDIYLREEARKGNLNIFVTLPFLTTLADTFVESDILGKIDDRNPSIINNVIFRKSLSWGADTNALLQLIKRRLQAQKPVGDRGMIYAHLVAHYLSDDYQNY